MYTVHDEKFEGPLDLLLSLIEKEHLDITQISLAKITGSYLDMIANIEGDSSDLADFLVIAAKLLYIKSKNLIPNVTCAEEEAELEDLETRLRDYQHYKNAAKHLDDILSSECRSYTRKVKNESIINFIPPQNIDTGGLFAIFQEVLNRVETIPEKTELKQKPGVTLEEKKITIAKHLSKTGVASFRKILSSAKSKVEVIVTFLAILEMVKQKEVSVEQTGNFADFTIKSVK